MKETEVKKLDFYLITLKNSKKMRGNTVNEGTKLGISLNIS